MIIYIYGSENFKKEIHEILVHSNIRLRLDDNSDIIDLNTLDELKNAIEDNPNNIYLIDDTKIIKKNSINKKLKFLTPKDGIEQEYLLDHGIGDISVDSIEELSKHLIHRIESSMDDSEASQIQDSIVEIVEDAYSNDDNYQLDDELSALLANDEEKIDDESFDEEELKDMVTEIEDDVLDEKISNIDDISFAQGKELDDILEKELEEDNSLASLKDLDFDEDFDNIDIENSDNEKLEQEEIKNVQGDEMADEFSEFDTLNEDDILEALNELNTKVESSFEVPKVAAQEPIAPKNEDLEVSSASVNEIASLISKLLNNKTLEITIKVKE